MSVYLLHLDPPYRHARHYVGFATCVARRVAHHRAGTGARFTQVVVEAGHAILLARVWRGRSRRFERALKNREYGSLDALCPRCQGRPNARGLKLVPRRRSGRASAARR